MACLKVRNIRVCQTDPKENPWVGELVPLAAAFEAFRWGSVLRTWTRLSMAMLLWSAHEGGLVGLRLGALSMWCGIEVHKYNLENHTFKMHIEIKEGLLKIENYLEEILLSDSPPFGLTLHSSMTISFHHQIRAEMAGSWSPHQQ